MKAPEIYEDFKSRRSSCSDNVLNSSSEKMIIMAGPGTGKSYLFQQIAEQYRKNGKEKIIVLSFINELVKDLAVDMHGLAEVSTLHSFATKQLKNSQNLYMDLLNVVSLDFEVIAGEKKDFSTILHNLNTTERAAIDFMRVRRNYYASLDPSGAVFELVNYLKANPNKIPLYDLVLVDEYQDLNLLEVELIDILSAKNKILIAGDDDQSLYSFKHSVPDNIRKKYNDASYEAFELPYCSRCTEVVLEAFRDVICMAQKEGHLGSRIKKEYLYFPTEDKDIVSARYPTINVRCNTNCVQNAFFIDSEIEKVFGIEPKFDVLIICPLKKQINSLGVALRKIGYENISGDGLKVGVDQKLINGLNLLLEDKLSNLGWRLCAESLIDLDNFKTILEKTSDHLTPFKNIVPVEIQSQVRALRAACVKLKGKKVLSSNQQRILFEKLKIDIERLGEDNARNMLFCQKSNKVYHGVKIKITTILGSKGLSYDHVFMVNFDDKYLCGDIIDDEKINKFLVALTRSRKNVNIFTSQSSEPLFVAWINQSRKRLL